MSNNDFIAEIQKYTPVDERGNRWSKKECKAALEAFTQAVESVLANGEEIRLQGFGTFKVNERTARTGRNPKTGEPIDIPAKKIPAFKAGKNLKEAVED